MAVDAALLNTMRESLLANHAQNAVAVRPAPGGGPKQLSIRHMEIMDYLMANPRVKLGDVAKHFGVTPGWLSQIIHSDAFQKMLVEKQGIAFHETVLSIREKMELAAHQTLDRLLEVIPQEQEASTLGNVAEGLLDRLGFGSKAGAPNTVINNNVTVLANELKEAQAHIRGRGATLEIGLGGKPVALSGEGSPAVGEADYIPALPSPGTEGSKAADGGEV